MKQGDLVKVIKNDMSLAFNARTKRKDNRFFHKTGIILYEFNEPNLARQKWRWPKNAFYHIWYSVYFGSIGIYHLREDTMMVDNESR